MGNLDSPATKGAQFSAQKWKVVISLQGEIWPMAEGDEKESSS